MEANIVSYNNVVYKTHHEAHEGDVTLRISSYRDNTGIETTLVNK